MNNRFLSSLFLFLSIGTLVQAADSEPLQEIGQNITKIGSNLCSFTESAAQVLQGMTLTGTNIAAGLTSLVARFPKMTILAAASSMFYVSWRSYQHYRFKYHLDAAKVFLHRTDDRIPVAQSNVLRIVNLHQNASQATLQNYIHRIEELRNNLLPLSKLNEWADADQDFADLLNRGEMTVAYTQDQVTQIEDYINPRVAALGLPQYYAAVESPWVWIERIKAPWCAGSNINPLKSYAAGLIDVYEGEATKLMWQLFKWEKALRARLVP